MQCSVAGSSSTFKPPCSSRRQHRQGHCSCWWPFHTEIPTILLLHEDIHQKESSFSSDRQSRAEEELLHKASVGVNRNITYRHSNASLLGDTEPHGLWDSSRWLNTWISFLAATQGFISHTCLFSCTLCVHFCWCCVLPWNLHLAQGLFCQ